MISQNEYPQTAASEKVVVLLSGALSHLATFPCTKRVTFKHQMPSDSLRMALWESSTKHYYLPIDLRKFYSTCDGFHVPWKTTNGQDVGCFQIRSIVNLTKSTYVGCPGEAYHISGAQPFGDVYLVYPRQNHHHHASHTTSNSDDDVVRANSNPSVYFYSNAKWYPLAPNFTAFFRLMIANLGISGWPMACTLEISQNNEDGKCKVVGGLSPKILEWLNLYAPERARMYFQEVQKLSRRCWELNNMEVRYNNKIDDLNNSIVFDAQYIKKLVRKQKRPSSAKKSIVDDIILNK